MMRVRLARLELWRELAIVVSVLAVSWSFIPMGLALLHGADFFAANFAGLATYAAYRRRAAEQTETRSGQIGNS